MELDRPIFIVGHARGGSTVLGAIINWHSHVGPKYNLIKECSSINDLLEKISQYQSHIDYSSKLEQKNVWFDFFPGQNVFTHMGKELIVENLVLTQKQIHDLLEKLVSEFHEKRFLSKAPTNSFRVKVIRALFPNAKIVAIYRKGEGVVESWGKRHYGFGKKVDWGEIQIPSLSYIQGIRIFARKWFETIDYLESVRDNVNILPVTYDQLTNNTTETIRKVFDYLELPEEDYIYDIKLKKPTSGQKKTIPFIYRSFLSWKVKKGNAILRSL